MQHVAIPTENATRLDDEEDESPSRKRHEVLTDMIDAHQRARKEALAYMIRFAAEMGANAVIGVRYDTAKLSETQTEFLAYGTAVWAEPLP
jgi:uncharacterized protein YbjQ (UPF0145 family)